MKLRWPWSKGGSGAVASAAVSVSSADYSTAGGGGLSLVAKGGLPIEWERVLGGGEGGGASPELRRAYAQSVWVSRAIKHVAEPLCAVPLLFSQDKRGGDMPVDDAKLTAFWEKPATCKGGPVALEDLIEATVGWLKLRGNAFWLMDDTWIDSRAKKSPLILARPSDMRPVLEHGSRELSGWIWTAANGRKEVLIPEQVVHFKYFNPDDEIWGLAEWEAAKVAADSDYAAGVFARNLMANNGDRGPYVIAKAGTPSDPQVQQITTMLRQKREMSRRGEFRAAFLTADVDVKEPGLQAVDAAFVTQRLENRHEIYAAFGVPMSFADVVASYSIGSASDYFRLIEVTCMPMGKKLCNGIEQVTELFLGRPVFAAFNWDEHSTIQQVRAERVDSAVKLVDRGMPWKQANDYLRLKMPEFKGWEIGRVPFNLEEIGQEARDKEPEPGEEEAEPLEELEKLFRNMPTQAPGGCPGCGGGTKAGTGEVHKTWERVQKRRRPWEKKMRNRISRLLMDARAETLKKLAALVAADAEGKSVKSLDVLSFIFDLGKWLPDWVTGLSKIDKAALEASGVEVWNDELGKSPDDPLILPSEKVQVAIALRENRLRNAGQKVWDKVRKDLKDAIDQGTPNAELAKAVRKSFAGIDDARSEAIAATEITAVYEAGRHMTFKEAGVQWKQWLHSGLTDHARPSHMAANEQIRELDEPFDIGGVPMMHPGDPEAEAEEVIKCRCVSIAVAGPDGGDIEGEENDDIPY